MSGFLIAARPLDLARWGERLSFVSGAHCFPLSLSPLSAVFSRLDDPALWAPASDPASGVTLALAGRPAFDQAQWRRADSLPYNGGLASRLLLDAWLNAPAQLVRLVNGACCVFVHDVRAARLHLFTDRMGAFPVYAASGAELCLCSHPDVLADYLTEQQRPPSFDTVTMAEMLATGASVQPHTYYREIAQLDAATHYAYCLTGSGEPVGHESYWSPPRAASSTGDLRDLAAEFAAGLRTAGLRRAFLPGKNGLLLSGGADSRALLYTSVPPAAVESITFCDRDNAEVDTARAIAATAGSPHHVLYRTPEHYGEGAAESVRVTGGMWSIKDAHYHGFAGVLRELELGNLMTGCYTDYLYKGLGYNKTAQRVLGKRLSLDALAPYASEYYQPHAKIAEAWSMRVRERTANWIRAEDIAAYADDPFAVEDRRIRPLSREADAMGRLYLLRTQPWDPVMIENELIDLYGRIPPALKLNARVFRAAVAQVVPAQARHIRNNNDYSPIGASEPARVLRYLWRKAFELVARRLSGSSTETLSTHGSWPNFSYYVGHSAMLADQWARPSAGQRELLADLVGEDPFQTPLAVWAVRDIDLILRLLTLQIWLGQRGI